MSPEQIFAIDTRNLRTRIGNRLRAHRSALMQEAKMHDAIAAALTETALVYEREYSLSPTERLDFWLPERSIALEVKKGRAGLGDMPQIGRYLAHAQVAAVILIAMRIEPDVPEIFQAKLIVKLELWRYVL